MKRITVVGTGYVGLVDGIVLAEKGNQVLCYDKDEAKIDFLKKGQSPIYEIGLEEMLQRNLKKGKINFTDNKNEAFEDSEIIIIGVGTPQTMDGNANLSFVMEAIHDIIDKVKQDCLVVVKSTVPIGTCAKIDEEICLGAAPKFWLEVASNPEFLSQGTALFDALHPSRIVIGTKSKRAEELLKEIYVPFEVPIVAVSRESAEMIKYASNSFLAIKISYINEVANLCEALGADVLEVVEGMKHDPRIGSAFLNPGIGFGGSCLPKDATAFSFLAKTKGANLNLVEAAIETNEKQKVRLFQKAKKYFGSLKGLKIAILGLSFKANTDDLRNAPSLENIIHFLDEGALVHVYDPVALKPFSKTKLSQRVIICPSINEALTDCQAAFVFTEWEELRKLEPQDFSRLMNLPIVFDGRNIFDRKEMEKAGVKYFAIGR